MLAQNPYTFFGNKNSLYLKNCPTLLHVAQVGLSTLGLCPAQIMGRVSEDRAKSI